MAADGDADSLAETERTLVGIEAALHQMDLQRLLGGEHDPGNAIVQLQAGAGGTEAQDWCEMLLRQYLRWCERHDYKTELVDSQPGEGAGIKSASFTVEGPYAFGYLKSEVGVHRLVRISPFDANARRHTSFASVFVYPEIDDTVEVEIDEKDLRIDTYRSSGAGGQHVNKTDSAVRITHIPTGVVVTSSEKSQHQNRAKAMKNLQARLYDMQRQALDDARSDSRKSQVGSGDRSERIRTYNFPQGRVTDHRINLTLYNLANIVAGDALDDVISPLIAEDQAARLAQLEDS